MEKPNGIALVVEGGAMRGVFSTGVLDAFLTKNLIRLIYILEYQPALQILLHFWQRCINGI